MLYEDVNFLSLFGKKMVKYNDNIKLRQIVKKNDEINPKSKLVDCYIDKNGIQKPTKYEIKRDKKKFKSFFEKLFNYSYKDKEDKEKYFSKIKGYKNVEEENYIKEKRKKRYQDIISLKKKRAYFESIKLYPNYSNITNIPYLKDIVKEQKIEKNKINNLTDRTNKSKIDKNNNNYLPIPSLPGIDKINTNKKFSSLQTSKTNRIIDISTEKSITNTNRTIKNFLSPRGQMRLFNIKIKKKKIKNLLGGFNFNKNKNNLFQKGDKYSSLKNNSDSCSNNKSDNNNDINESPLNKNRDIKRASSLIIKKDGNLTLYNYNNKKKMPIKLNKYKKKWDSPKTILFDKNVRRDDFNKKKKFCEMEGTKSYFPNYNSIFIDNNKSFVSYGKNKDILFKNYKIGCNRKLITNRRKLDNSPLNSYIVMDIINEEKKRKEEEKINKLKEKFGEFYELLKKVKK